jgi:hypothetical protein
LVSSNRGTILYSGAKYGSVVGGAAVSKSKVSENICRKCGKK